MTLDLIQTIDNFKYVISLAKEHSFRINLNDLLNEYRRIEPKLTKIIGDTLYYFETDTKEDADFLLTLLDKNIKELKKNDRTYPKHRNESETKILYLGVRQGGLARKREVLSNVAGRMWHHFGLYDKGSTQGVQLEYWAKESNLTLNLHIYEFDFQHRQYLYILEKFQSIVLKPRLGKH